MPNDYWWQNDPERLEREWANANYSLRAVAKKHNTDHSTIAKWLDKHGLRAPRPTNDRFVFKHMEECRVSGDWMITSDWHMPIVDYGLVDRMISDAKRLGIKKLIVAGDWFNFDALSDYFPKQQDAGFPVELQDSNRLMDYLLNWFDEIVLTLANHDIRITKQLGYKLRFDHSMRVCFYDIDPKRMNKITITNRDYVLVDTPKGVWRICHTNNYSKTQLAYPSKLAEKYRQHVAAGHRHHHAIGFSVSGYNVLELGGLFDASRTEYLSRWSNDFPIWQQGYSALIGGKVYCPMLSLC